MHISYYTDLFLRHIVNDYTSIAASTQKKNSFFLLNNAPNTHDNTNQ